MSRDAVPPPASFLAEIQRGRGLRPTETKDLSVPRLEEAREREQAAEVSEAYFLDLGLDAWLPLVEDLSFETVSLPLSPEEARLLRECYAHAHSAGKAEHKPSLSPQLLGRLAPLLARLSPVLRQMGAAFVKLSGRSSKDAPLYTKQLGQRYGDALSRRLGSGSEEDDDNTRLYALFEAALGLMRVEDAAQAVCLLIKSSRRLAHTPTLPYDNGAGPCRV